jgi:hypothetical protein
MGSVTRSASDIVWWFCNRGSFSNSVFFRGLVRVEAAKSRPSVGGPERFGGVSHRDLPASTIGGVPDRKLLVGLLVMN